MYKKIRVISLLVLLGVVAGCATSPHLVEVSNPEEYMAPESGKALVVFMRPSSFGGAIQATLYDGMDYFATISAQTRVAYQAEPGEHLFMVIGESADFMAAELLPEKTYYALVTPRMGVWKARFSLKPINDGFPDEDFQDYLESTRLMRVNPEGEQWAEENRQSIVQKHDEYLAKWNSKPEAEKPMLYPTSGR